MKLVQQIKDKIDKHYSYPKGIIGVYIGEKMVKQHKPETYWTLQLLHPQPNDTILELGCGAGYAIKLLAQLSRSSPIVGMDISKSVLRSASARNRIEIRKGRITFVHHSVNHIPFQNETFSKIFSIHSIYFWTDLSETISEIYRVLKNDGTLLITLYDGKNGIPFTDNKVLIEQKVIPGLTMAGFRNIEVLRGPQSREFDSHAIKAKK
ncbi:MAG: hypothetical protein K0S47_118 [Herbinix sp.]|nr:hypothetical protein [Herbinix sp.]